MGVHWDKVIGGGVFCFLENDRAVERYFYQKCKHHVNSLLQFFPLWRKRKERA